MITFCSRCCYQFIYAKLSPQLNLLQNWNSILRQLVFFRLFDQTFQLKLFLLSLKTLKTVSSGHAQIEKLSEVYARSDIYQEILKTVQSEKEPSSQIVHENPGYQQNSNKSRITAGFFSQLRYLTAHALWINLLHPGLYWSRIMVFVLLDLIVAAMFNRSNKIKDEHKVAMIYFNQSCHVLLTVAALPYLILARPVFCREQANGLISAHPYILSTFFAMVPGKFSIFSFPLNSAQGN